MKKLITIITLLITTTAFAQDCDFSYCSNTSQFTYIKLGGSILTGSPIGSGPAISIGRRYEENDHAIDISLNYGSGIKGITWATPKILYLQYIDPNESKSFYYGGGLSWGGLYHDTPKRKFMGLMAEIAFGWDLTRFCETRTFIEINLSQPMLATDRKHHQLSPPALSLTYGIGF